MKYPELSERTIRQRRNVLVMSVLILAIKTFEIDVAGVSVSVTKLENLDTTAIVFILGVAIVYSTIAAAWNGWNEFQHWRIIFKDAPSSGFVGENTNNTILDDIVSSAGNITQGMSRVTKIYESIQNTVSATPELPGICEKLNGQIPRITEGTEKMVNLCDDYKNHIRSFSRSAFWRLILLEATFPLLLAGFALASSFGWVELCGIGTWIRE